MDNNEVVEKKKSVFETLSTIDVSSFTEKKPSGKKKDAKGNWVDAFLTYLSWMNAWAVTKKTFPSATYEVERFENKPYLYDDTLGYMIFTKVIIEGESIDCWLPVMDSKHKAMKAQSYTYITNSANGPKENKVEAASMFDINTTIMRCLAKNLAMHGLGAYIYAGEDLPFTWNDESKEPADKAPSVPVSPELQANIAKLFELKNEIAKEKSLESYQKIEKHIKDKFINATFEQASGMQKWLGSL